MGFEALADGRPPPRDAGGSGTIDVTFTGLDNARGHVIALLFKGQDGWPGSYEKSVSEVDCPITGRTALCHFLGIPAGRFAVAAYHDENDNRRFDQNFLGIPQEAYGFSNDARQPLGPPKYSEAEFAFDGVSLTLKIKVH